MSRCEFGCQYINDKVNKGKCPLASFKSEILTKADAINQCAQIVSNGILKERPYAEVRKMAEESVDYSSGPQGFVTIPHKENQPEDD